VKGVRIKALPVDNARSLSDGGHRCTNERSPSREWHGHTQPELCPSANVMLDGKPLGSTPLIGLSVPAGAHRVISIHGSEPKSLVVTTDPGTTETLAMNFDDGSATTSMRRAVASPGDVLCAMRCLAKGEAVKKAQGGSGIDLRAAATLSSAASFASACRPADGPTGTGVVRVSYNNDGSVNAVDVARPFAGTVTGSCVKMAPRRAKIPAFEGYPTTLTQSCTIPE